MIAVGETAKTVARSWVPCRTGPGVGYEKAGTAGPHDRMLVLAIEDGYALVRFEGQARECWVIEVALVAEQT